MLWHAKERWDTMFFKLGNNFRLNFSPKYLTSFLDELEFTIFITHFFPGHHICGVWLSIMESIFDLFEIPAVYQYARFCMLGTSMLEWHIVISPFNQIKWVLTSILDSLVSIFIRLLQSALDMLYFVMNFYFLQQSTIILLYSSPCFD